MGINNVARNKPDGKINKNNFDLEQEIESLVRDIEASVQRDFLILSETLNKYIKISLQDFFEKMDKNALNHELTMMKQKIDESDKFWEEYLHPFSHLT